MTVLRRFAPLALALTGALPPLFFACTSADSSLLGGAPAQPGADASPVGDSAATTTPIGLDAPASFIVDSAPPDTFVPLNAVDAADIPEGGTRVSPGVIGCGPQATCNAFASNQCCVGATSVCQAASVSCPPGAVSVTCNEAADCVVGKVCCGTVGSLDGGSVGVSAECATTCAVPPRTQLCRTNGECPDGGPCVVQTCSDGKTYELCGLYASPDDGGAFSCAPN